ncbi:hypothetical protein RB195_017079 [Necator americanus]|uniref:Secreted protein n=1 Tax=Necator americanus TaxID=51031 RepID=A0ABR1C3H7_NECAM
MRRVAHCGRRQLDALSYFFILVTNKGPTTTFYTCPPPSRMHRADEVGPGQRLATISSKMYCNGNRFAEYLVRFELPTGDDTMMNETND